MRIEEDKQITKLLKKHFIFELEYDLNVIAQGYRYLQLEKVAPIIHAVVMATIMMEIYGKAMRTMFKVKKRKLKGGKK